MNISKNQHIYRLQLIRPELLTARPTEKEATILGDHVLYLENLAEQSKVFLAGRNQTNEPSRLSIVILNTGTEDEAMGIMRNDPAVKHGMMHTEFFPTKS